MPTENKLMYDNNKPFRWDLDGFSYNLYQARAYPTGFHMCRSVTKRTLSSIRDVTVPE